MFGRKACRFDSCRGYFSCIIAETARYAAPPLSGNYPVLRI